jgi:hypothetical protein
LLAATDLANGQLVHAVSYNVDAFSSSVYPVLASSFDVMALVNLGQGKFWYALANTRCTVDPCFVRTASGSDGRSNGGSLSLGLNFDDLFSMGRVDSRWMEASRMGKSRKEGSGAPANDLEAESNLALLPPAPPLLRRLLLLLLCSLLLDVSLDLDLGVRVGVLRGVGGGRIRGRRGGGLGFIGCHGREGWRELGF